MLGCCPYMSINHESPGVFGLYTNVFCYVIMNMGNFAWRSFLELYIPIRKLETVISSSGWEFGLEVDPWMVVPPGTSARAVRSRRSPNRARARPACSLVTRGKGPLIVDSTRSIHSSRC